MSNCEMKMNDDVLHTSTLHFALKLKCSDLKISNIEHLETFKFWTAKTLFKNAVLIQSKKKVSQT